jgi:hypothetical protein
MAYNFFCQVRKQLFWTSMVFTSRCKRNKCTGAWKFNFTVHSFLIVC